MPNKFAGLLRKLPLMALKSSIQHQHGAVIIKNGSPIIWGFNSIKGQKTYHAEHDVLRKFLNLKGFKGMGGNQPRILWKQTNNAKD